jgi:hypothetical protein
MAKKLLDNDGKHLEQVLNETTCKKHKASLGDPCYVITPGTKTATNQLLGACNARILRAGFDGKISETSFQTRRSSGPSEGRKTHHKKKEAA